MFDHIFLCQSAKLLVEGQIIREHNLFIESDGWLGTLDYTKIPKYITNDQITGDKLAFPEEIINEINHNHETVIPELMEGWLGILYLNFVLIIETPRKIC